MLGKRTSNSLKQKSLEDNPFSFSKLKKSPEDAKKKHDATSLELLDSLPEVNNLLTASSDVGINNVSSSSGLSDSDDDFVPSATKSNNLVSLDISDVTVGDACFETLTSLTKAELIAKFEKVNHVPLR